MSNDQFRVQISFIVPSGDTLEMARKSLESSDSDKRNVAKSILDATDISIKTRDKFLRNENVDVAPYFDHWFGDTIESAHRLLQSTDIASRNIALSLIALEKDILRSKEDFLIEAKRFQDLDNAS